MPGYLCVPETSSGDGIPAVIDVGGIDAFTEEHYFKIGSELIERGYAVLLLNGPGQGAAKLRGIFGRYDFETVAAAAVDYLQAQPGVDDDRIGLIGSSLGGYFAARAAAFEPRLRATVIWGANPGFSASTFAPGSGAASRINQFERFLGVKGAEAVQDLGIKFRGDERSVSSGSHPPWGKRCADSGVRGSPKPSAKSRIPTRHCGYTRVAHRGAPTASSMRSGLLSETSVTGWTKR